VTQVPILIYSFFSFEFLAILRALKFLEQIN
jgi:hypothetical protein